MKKIIFLLIGLSMFDTIKADWLTPELLWKLGRVSDAQLSPDGNSVVYNIRNYNLEANKGNSDLWLYDFKSKTTHPISADSSNETMPRWSRDGKKIYFLNDKGSSQVWSMNPDGTDKQQISNTASDINLYGFSANGNSLWLSMDVKLDAFLGKDKYNDLPKATGHVYDDLMMRHWDSWADGNYSHIFYSELSNGKLKGNPIDLMKDEHYDSPMKPDGGDEEIAISPDGKMIAYTCKKMSNKDYALTTNSEIYLYDVTSGKTTNVSLGNDGYDKSPIFSNDGKSLAWISWQEPGNEASKKRLMLYNFESRSKHDLTISFDFDVESIVFSGNDKKIYFMSDIAATDQIFYCDLTAKTDIDAIKQLTSDTADYNGFSLTSVNGNDKLIATRMSISEPTEVFNIDLKSGKSTQLTFTNRELLSQLTLGKVEKRMIRATDGKDILTWVIYPPNFNPKNKYPTLLYCQGGPQSTVSQFFSYRWNFQLMAANQYIVVAPNRRGLPGFGQAWNDEISGDWGGQAMKDLLSSIDSVAKEPFVDKNHLGAVGASFGGFSVFWLAGNHARRFKCFISHCGVFNLESMLATEELFFHNHEFDGGYWRSPKPVSYEKFSPHRFVNNWDTPIMIISNERDYRVPYTQGLEAYSAARMKNIPARFLSFPDEGHWVLKPQNSIMWQREFFDWLNKYLK